MKTFIVLIPVEGSVADPRKACEMIENTKFNINDNVGVTSSKVLHEIMFELGVNHHHNIEVYPMTDFMDRFNDEVLNVDGYFMSYVYA